jgi:hypothetical protein
MFAKKPHEIDQCGIVRFQSAELMWAERKERRFESGEKRRPKDQRGDGGEKNRQFGRRHSCLWQRRMSVPSRKVGLPIIFGMVKLSGS